MWHNSFDKILSPFLLDDFFNTYYEKDILHINRNDESFYKNILTSKEISDFLDRQDIFYPSLRIVKNGKEIPNSEYTLKSVPIGHHKKDGIINTEKAFALFNSGATFVVQAAQRIFKPLSQCCFDLSKKFNSPVQANLYITPNKSQGFNPHWDTHDVFVLQISGSKTWHLYGFEKELPTKNQIFVSKDYNKPPIKTLQLFPGDLLYVPRGYVHDAMADDGTSSHITIGVLSFTWIRFFNEVFPQLEDYKDFREAVPFWKANLSEIIQDKINLLQQKLSELNYAEGIDRMNKGYQKAQPQPTQSYFESIRKLGSINIRTTFYLNTNILFNVIEEENKISFLGKTISFAEHFLESIHFILRKKKFTIAELPGNISDNEKKNFAETLVREGMIYIADDK